MERKIKILQVITRLDKGGSAELALLACRKIDPARFEPVLVYGGASGGDYYTGGVTRVNLPALVREISPLKDFIAFCRLFLLLKKEQPDIVQTNSSKAGFIGRWSAWLYNLVVRVKGSASREGGRSPRTIKIVHMPHGHVFYGYGFGNIKTVLFIALEKLSAKITDKLIAVSEGEKNESLFLGVGKPGQWVVIPPGTSLAGLDPSAVKDMVRRELGIPQNAIVVGTAARFEPVKGIIHLMEAAALVQKLAGGDVRFLFIGDGSLKKELESRAAALGLSGKSIFTGMSSEVERMMCALDIYVQPSLNEGLGKTLVLAHSLGLPIVASRVQGIPDVVLDAKTGFLVRSTDDGELAAKLLELIADPELRNRMGKAGKEWVTRKEDGLPYFGEERTISLLEKLYERLLG